MFKSFSISSNELRGGGADPSTDILKHLLNLVINSSFYSLIFPNSNSISFNSEALLVVFNLSFKDLI